MFVVEPSLKQLRASRDGIVTLVESINQPHVAVPGRAAQAARAYVVGLRESSGNFALYVYLWLSRTGEAVVYVPETRAVPLESYRDLELEATQFCESMGFMTEPVGFRNLSPEAQDELLARLPPFRGPEEGAREPAAAPPPPAAAAPRPAEPARGPELPPEERERIARLLASF